VRAEASRKALEVSSIDRLGHRPMVVARDTRA
jgi:hypothetical protein